MADPAFPSITSRIQRFARSQSAPPPTTRSRTPTSNSVLEVLLPDSASTHTPQAHAQALEALRAECTFMQSAGSLLDQRIDRLQASLQTAKTEVSTVLQDNAALEWKNARLEVDVEIAERRISALEQENAELKKKTVGLEVEVEDGRQTMKKLEDGRQMVNYLFQELRERHAGLEMELIEAKQQVSNLAQENTNLQRENLALEVELELANQRLSELEHANAWTNDTLAIVNEGVVAATECIKTLEEVNTSLEDDLATAREEIKRFEEEIDILETDLVTRTDALAAAEERANVSKSFESILKEREDLLGKVMKLEDEALVRAEENDTLKRRMICMGATLNLATKEKSDALKKKALALAQLSALKDKSNAIVREHTSELNPLKARVQLIDGGLRTRQLREPGRVEKDAKDDLQHRVTASPSPSPVTIGSLTAEAALRGVLESAATQTKKAAPGGTMARTKDLRTVSVNGAVLWQGYWD